MNTIILTTQDRPDHETIGRRFRAYCPYDAAPADYVCDSHQSNAGYWMVRADAPDERRQDEQGKWRRNVSERAIGQTFRRIDD